MSVEFQEEQVSAAEKHILYSRFESSNKVPKIINALIKSGVVKNERQANIFLLCSIFVILLLSVFLIIKTNSSSTLENSRSITIQNTI